MKHKSATGRLIWLATTALMLMAMIPAAFAASSDTASMQPSAVCYPTAVTQSDDGGEIRKMYDLSPEDDPAGIPHSDFEQDGYHYELTDLLKQELPEYESRQHTETVTVSSKSKDMATVLSLLPQEREFITDDGLLGVLSLRLDSVKVAVAGYGSSTKELTVSRTYPGLSNQDTSPIPKSVEKDGHTLALSTVNWQRDGEDGSEQYTAVATYLDEITGGRGVIFATGTPISNSMVELYTIQRYLQYSALEEMRLTFFDDWASDFGEIITAIELSPEGTGYRAKTRFAKFFNLPELMSTFKQVADIQTADMLQLPVPKANFHTEVLKPSELQQEMIKGLAERAEKIRNREVDPSVDNMLKITNDGRKLALDMRLINPLAADDPNGKVAVCARNVYQIWENTKEQRSAQLVFCDLSTPKGDGTFNVYDDLRKKLMEAGIPEEEIAFIHDSNTEVKKKELFARVRSGQVRVLMGSTQKMGAGTNVQDRLIALHDLDCPWRPSDLAQRLGRIVRQGNENPEVEIFRYVTEGTFDAYLYQLVENKQMFIAQIMTSKAPVRIADDVDETALSYSEIKALATGNPLIIEKCNLDMEVGKLNVLKANYLSQKYGLEEMVLRKYPAEIQQLTERIAGYEQDVALTTAHPKPQEGFVGIEINGTTYTDKEAAGKAILDVCTKMTGSDAVPLGQYRGFSLTLAYDGVQNEYRVTLKGTLSHTAVLGADVLGNLTRMDNKLGGLEEQLVKAREKLAENRIQLENAKQELAAPFAKESELAEKEARLKELNILLNMDQKDNTLLDDPDEEITTPERSNYTQER